MTEKLVRNGPGFRLRADGATIRVADRAEMPVLLARKLVEEAQEVLAAVQGDEPHADVVGELADVTEAIRGLRRAMHVRKDDIRAARRAKRMREGDFDQQLVWVRDDG